MVQFNLDNSMKRELELIALKIARCCTSQLKIEININREKTIAQSNFIIYGEKEKNQPIDIIE